jgi:Ca2+-binding EF-hand superfamily protein
MRWLTTAIVLVAAATVAHIAAAVEIDADGLFAQLDADGNGRVTAAEAGDGHGLLFARMLRNVDDGDGALTAEEFAAALTPVRADKVVVEKQSNRLPGSDALIVMVFAMDSNGDRQLDEAECPAAYRGAFAAMLQRGDEDKNGRLDSRELAAGGPQLGRAAQLAAARMRLDVPAELAKIPADRRMGIERMGAMQNPREMLADPQQRAELFARLDANGDKLISPDEAPEGLANIIRRGDRNGDGKLSEAELERAARQQGRFQRRPFRPRPSAPPETMDEPVP